MTRAFAYFLIGAGVVLILVSVFGCRTSAQSWDQENLKRNDKGCPGSIYTAPNGELQLCPPM
jgi:hypothetical protein